jgi:trehalose 6-phosphate phosphatase
VADEAYARQRRSGSFVGLGQATARERRLRARAEEALPDPDLSWAYFLDVDGTLVDLAPSPSAVRVEPDTHDLVHGLHLATGGAVALISGRSLHDLDLLFPGGALPAAGQHGLERRSGRGHVWRLHVSNDSLSLARARCSALASRHRELIVEDKGLSLAVHFRAAPHLETQVHDAVRAIVAELGDGYVVQPGKLVVELRPAGSNKGEAIATFMSEEPFRGRVPVFLGDDVTDEHGFAVVNAMGGHSLKVGEGATIARWRLPDVRAVERWLTRADDLVASSRAS